MSTTIQPPEPAVAPAPTGRGWNSVEEVLGLDLRSLALFRIGIALVVLANLVIRLPDLVVHYTDAGMLPRTALPPYLPISVHVLSGSAVFQALLFLLHAVAAVALLVGHRTRVANLVCWFLLISLHARNPVLMHGGDTVMRMLLFWGMFLPLGACYSLDSLHRARPERWTLLTVGSLGFTLQLCFIYWFAVAWKYDPVWRTEGTGVYYSMHASQLTTAWGRSMLNYPWLLTALSRFTLVQEGIIPCLLFVPFRNGPLRTFVVVSFILFHMGLGVCLDLGTFPYTCGVGWLAMLPPWFWDGLAAWVRTPARTRLTVYFDAADERWRERVAFWRTFLLLGDARWISTADDATARERVEQHHSWVIVDAEGREHAGFDGLVALVRQSPVYWPLAPFLAWGPVRRAGEARYQRPATEAQEPADELALPAPGYTSGFSNVLAGFFLVYIFLWNVRGVETTYMALPPPPGNGPAAAQVADPLRALTSDHFPPQVNCLGIALGLDQGWGMFAPSPGKYGGWCIVQATLKDGSQVDLLRGAPVSQERPPDVNATYGNEYWHRWYMCLFNPYSTDFIPIRPCYADYLSRTWNASHPDRPVETIELFFMLETTPPPGGEPAPVEKVPLVMPDGGYLWRAGQGPGSAPVSRNPS